MKHIVSFSGGKDSTAMLLMLLEKGWQVDEIRAFDSGWEFPQMYDHWRQVEEYTGMPITIVRSKKSFNYWLLEHKVMSKGEVRMVGVGWPVIARRWCTREKVRSLYRERKNCAWYVGMASDEQDRTFSATSESFSGKRVYPLIEWGITEADALEYCYAKGFTWGGLYKHFKRVSCYCCPLQRIGDLRKLRKYYSELWSQMLEWDKAISTNNGFNSYGTVVDLERYFAHEDAQREFCFAEVEA